MSEDKILNIIDCWKNGDYVLAYSFNYDRAGKQNELLLKYITNLQQENKQLKQRNKEIYDGFMVAIDEVCETDREKRKYKERIDKVIEYIKENTDNTNFIEVPSKELLEILGGKE